MFAPATLSEYLGLPLDFGDRVDLGGATAAGMVWRAAAAVELGQCDAVLAVVPGSTEIPRSEREARPDAQLVRRVEQQLRLAAGRVRDPVRQRRAERPVRADRAALRAPNSATTQRLWRGSRCTSATNACAHPGAVFHGKPITVDDVLNSPVIADPIHMLETVMRVQGGAGVLIANADVARRARHRPVWIKGFGEHIRFKTPTYADDLIRTPIARAAERAFAMAGLQRSDVDMASIYDCYTITVLMTLEDAGFCGKGEGMAWLTEHDLTFRGDFPVNTAGGQLSYGQAGMAGGMHHVVDGARQVMGRSGDAQVADCNTAFVTGNGGIMSEQVALILGGD